MIQTSSFRPALLAIATALTALPAAAQVPGVVTDIPVVGALVQQGMGDLGSPSVLIEAGGDPHHYQLRPSQAASLQGADLLIWVGPELTPWLTRASQSMEQDRSLALLALDRTHRQDYGIAAAPDHDHDHGHDHGHEDDQGQADQGHDDHDDHDHSGLDPHAWLDPRNGQIWLGAIADALSERDADNAATYHANAERAVAELAALDGALRDRLAPVRDKDFVVFHDAYGYFTAHYGLKPAIPVSLGDASAPSAARLKAIQQQIQDSGAVCAFPEANHDPKLLQVVTEGTALRSGAALDPEGVSETQGAGLYAAILTGIGTALSACLDQD